MASRKKISLTIANDLLWQADHTCCMCGKRRDVQIHHIDGHSDNSSTDNLIPLCPNCHSDAEQKGGHGRRFGAAELRKYRDEHFRRVRQERQKITTTERGGDITALASFEVRRVSYEIEAGRTDWKLLEDRLLKLLPYARDFGHPVKAEIAYAASSASSFARMGMTLDVAHALQTVLLEILPIGAGGLRHPDRHEIGRHERELIRSVIETARGLAWDFSRYLRTVEGLEESAFVLSTALRVSHLNGLEDEEKEALEAFASCIGICAETQGGKAFEQGKRVLEFWRQEALSDR